MSDNILKFNKGDKICKQGEYEVWFYELLKGSVTVYKDYGLDSEVELGKVDKGFIGEMGFLNSMPRIGTVIAAEETEVAKIDEKTFNEYFVSHPDKILGLLRCLSGRLKEADVNESEAIGTIEDLVSAYDSKATVSTKLKDAMKKFSDIFKSRNA